MDPRDASFSSECDRPLYKKKELMMKHRSRNLTYSATLQSFGASPTMKILVGVRSALKELYALNNISFKRDVVICTSTTSLKALQA